MATLSKELIQSIRADRHKGVLLLQGKPDYGTLNATEFWNELLLVCQKSTGIKALVLRQLPQEVVEHAMVLLNHPTLAIEKVVLHDLSPEVVKAVVPHFQKAQKNLTQLELWELPIDAINELLSAFADQNSPFSKVKLVKLTRQSTQALLKGFRESSGKLTELALCNLALEATQRLQVMLECPTSPFRSLELINLDERSISVLVKSVSQEKSQISELTYRQLDPQSVLSVKQVLPTLEERRILQTSSEENVAPGYTPRFYSPVKVPGKQNEINANPLSRKRLEREEGEVLEGHDIDEPGVLKKEKWSLGL